ncbi:hypothetical protein QQ045_004191 [Rhodiola kirilowii]
MVICNLFVPTGIPTISSQSRSFFLTCSPIQTRRRAEKKSLIIHACELDGHSELHAGGGNGSGCCGGGGLYTPLRMKTPAGMYLSEFVQQPDNKVFSAAVEDQLRRLSDDRHKASQLMDSASISNRPEGELYKKIAERMIQETKVEVEETMYMLICRRFYKAGVHMLPRISDCMVQGRLELSSSIYSHGQLERILRPEALELVKRHVTRVTGLDADSNIKDYPELSPMHPDYIDLAYDCQLMNGHFFRSASFRYALEKIFAKSTDSKPDGGIKPKAKRVGTFKSYTRKYPTDFQVKLCAPTSNEAVNMMNKHLEALFSQFKASFSATKGLVMTSPGSIWRLALEGFAFGTFLWDAEYFVSKFYELDDDYEGLSYP